MTELENLQIEEVSLVDAGANPAANVTLFKRKDAGKMEKQTKPEVETAKPAVETAKPEVDALTVEKKNFEEVTATLKSLTERLNAHIEKAEDAEFLKVAQKYELLGEKAEVLAPKLKKMKAYPEIYETAIKTLDNALAAVQKAGTFEELGKRGDGGIYESKAQIEKIAAKIQADNPNLTRREALDKAFLAHPELQY